MIRNFPILALAIAFCFTVKGQHDTSITLLNNAPAKRSASHTVISIGNVADIERVHDFATALNRVLDTLNHNQTIIFNGDLTKHSAFDAQSCIVLDSLVEL